MNAIHRCVLPASALVLLALPACVDTSPLPFVEKTRDAGGDAATMDAAIVNACRECITGDDAPCRTIYDACAANAKCKQAADCAIASGCLAFGGLQDRIACSDPCFKQAGILDQKDPAIPLLLPFNACSLPDAVCGSACVSK